ncbi:hypothetical protein HGA64_03835 [Candidatus Falkowbacteria bacterium]|nr:hypothetical protein [Candidatus Falkowbacteria bacterium]
MNNKLIKITAAIIITLFPSVVFGATSTSLRSGYILLQVEKNGEAWYVFPKTNSRYYLNRPADAFAIMKKLAIGAKHDYIANTITFPARLSGLILLDTDRNGEAYYIYPKDRHKYYLGRPDDAFRIMKELGQGISTAGLAAIPIGNIDAAQEGGKKILLDVPFTSQAPFGGWSDLRQEDGCEEASSLMAVKWALGEKLPPDEALDKIIGSSDYTQKKYYEYRDISPVDTVNWIIKDYFNYQNAAVKYNVTMSEVIAELKKGNLIAAPMNGQALHNPFFTQPGPINHMLVIRGYDPIKSTFITNDPGTRHGELYEYDAKALYDAIRAYPTGSHEINKSAKKDIIVIWK